MDMQDDRSSGPQPDDAKPPQGPGGVAPRLESLVDEHEEEVSVNGHTVRRQGVYLLPNLFTTAALFAGFYAVIAAMRGDFESAPIAIFFAMVFDGLDGRVARLTNTSSKFGWSAAFIYVACAALRLARFNTQIDTADKNYFTGLASPAAACIIASTVWVCHDLGWVGDALPYELSVVVAILTATVGFLMISNFPYYSFKGIDFHGRVPFVVMIAVVLVFGLVTLDPPSILLVAFLAYAASGPVMLVIRRRG